MIRHLLVTLALIFPMMLKAEGLHWNMGRGYEPFKYATSDGIVIDNQTDTLVYDYYKFPTSSENLLLSFRAKNINGNPNKKYSYYNDEGKSVSISNPHWGFFVTTLYDTYAVTIKEEEKITTLEPVPGLTVSLYNVETGLSKSVTLTDKINPYDGDNIWNLQIADGRLILSAGDHSVNEIIEWPCHDDVTGFGFYAGWGDKVKISDINAEVSGTIDIISKPFEFNSVKTYLSRSSDPMEGYWALFDRELEESLVKLGGFYTLLCLKEGTNYNFYYIDGANINSKNWKAGDLKSIMLPTPFEGIYDVEWIDSMKEKLSHDIKAQTGDGNVILIQFPYQSSRIRLRKINN